MVATIISVWVLMYPGSVVSSFWHADFQSCEHMRKSMYNSSQYKCVNARVYANLQSK